MFDLLNQLLFLQNRNQFLIGGPAKVFIDEHKFGGFEELKSLAEVDDGTVTDDNLVSGI